MTARTPRTPGKSSKIPRGLSIGGPGALAVFCLSRLFQQPASAVAALGPSPAALEAAATRATSASIDAGDSSSGVAASDPRRALVGRTIFFDRNLSEPPGTSCATCHDPGKAFAGNNGSTVGVALGSRPRHFAKRNTPSVLYLKFVRPFHLHWEEDAPLVDAFGGFFWDGRVDSVADLVQQPLLNPDEMNAQSAALVAEKIKSAQYAQQFRDAFGAALEDDNLVLKSLGEAVAAYLATPEMSPFSSKYDDYIRGQTPLSSVEMRGLKLFKDSAKGGCSACHKMDDGSPKPERSLFTDYGFDAVAAPRNRALPANSDPAYFDLGLCERQGAEYKAKTEQFCGRFRTPSLRNVAVRTAFMHNGAFSKLRDVVAFYATRETNPERWYPSGVVYDDLPKRFRDNVNVDSAPYNRKKGEKPPLNDDEVDALVAFLETLTDAQYR